MSGIIKPSVGAQLKLDHPLSRGLIGAWLLNERSGDEAHDYSGRGNVGTLTNMDPAADWVGSLHGGALDFDGSNDYVNIGTPAILNSLQVPMTISGWFKQSATSGVRAVFGQYKSVADHQLIKMVRIDNGTFLYYVSTAAGGYQSYGSFTPAVNVWHFFAVVVSGSIASPVVTIYLDDNSQSSSLSALSSTPDTTVSIYIGNDMSGYGEAEAFNGPIEEIHIYDRALSAQEIAWLYAFPYAMFEEESPYWIPFRAAGGNTYNEAVTLSSTPACSHSPQADLLGSVAFASTPVLSPAAIADLLGSVGLASTPALAASAIADFYNSLTLASTPAAVMAAVADLIASLALASDPAFAALGGSDFYESLALSSSPALSIAVFKEAFGELSLASSPALSAAAIADLYAAITMATAGGISTAAIGEFFAALTLSSIPALSALGQIGGEVIQKMVMESIGVREKLLRIEKQEADGDIDIRNLILTNPYDEISPVSTIWERTEKLKKDA